MYEVNVGIEIGGEYYKAGSLIPETKVPKKSKKSKRTPNNVVNLNI